MIRRELFNNLPTLKEEDRLSLDLDITFEEVTDAVKQLHRDEHQALMDLRPSFINLFGE